MIQVESASKFYGDFQAVKEVSFAIRHGEITGLLGPNGAGKTTTLRMLTGYLKPDGGSIVIDGLSALDEPLAVRKKIGYLPESAPLYDDMIVLDYLQYIAEIRGIADAGGRIETVSAACGVREVMHKTIGELSKGYRQRVGLAHALMDDPEILILDEPTSGLDPNQIVEIRRLIREIGKTKTVVLSTHILSEVEAVCDRVIIINRGSVVADDRTANLKNIAGDRDIITVLMQGPMYDEALAGLATLEGFVSAEGNPSEGLLSLTVTASAASDLRPLIFSLACSRGWIIYELSRQRQSLEHIFRDLTGGTVHENS